jgi:hypothetical protein
MRSSPFWDFYAVSNCNSVATFRDNLSVHREGSSSSRKLNIFEGRKKRLKGGVSNKVVVSTTTREQTDVYTYVLKNPAVCKNQMLRGHALT